jgi:hypothetical protein
VGLRFYGWLLRVIDNFDWTSIEPAARVSARRNFIQTLE